MGLEEIVLAEPRGFCAGVDRAIEIVERALKKFGAPIYVRHEIVHNTYVVSELKAKGAVFIEELDEVPPGATLVFSAHGVSKAVRAEADGLQHAADRAAGDQFLHLDVLRVGAHLPCHRERYGMALQEVSLSDIRFDKKYEEAVENAQIAVLVVIDEPKGQIYGGAVAAPVFRKIAQATLNYLNVPPRTGAEKLRVSVDGRGGRG